MTPEERDKNWLRDALPEWNEDDALWLYTIRLSEVIRLWPHGALDDPVLLRLFSMGTFDWKGDDSKGPDSTRAMRYAASLSNCLLNKILKEGIRVSTRCCVSFNRGMLMGYSNRGTGSSRRIAPSLSRPRKGSPTWSVSSGSSGIGVGRSRLRSTRP